MSYLSKTERKKQILDAAMTIALDDGLNTLTVRNLAQRASLSVGLIHHHFKTIQELKCEVFMQLIYKNLDISEIDDNLSLTEKILLALGFTESEDELPYVRLWNDAEQNSQTSPEFNKVFSNRNFTRQNSLIIRIIFLQQLRCIQFIGTFADTFATVQTAFNLLHLFLHLRRKPVC